MAVTAASLVVSYPEFDNAPTATIEDAIDRAELQVDAAVLGDQYDAAVLQLACHLLAISQYGMDMRLSQDKQDTVFSIEFDRIMRIAGHAWRTVG